MLLDMLLRMQDKFSNESKIKIDDFMICPKTETILKVIK